LLLFLFLCFCFFFDFDFSFSLFLGCMVPVYIDSWMCMCHVPLSFATRGVNIWHTTSHRRLTPRHFHQAHIFQTTEKKCVAARLQGGVGCPGRGRWRKKRTTTRNFCSTMMPSRQQCWHNFRRAKKVAA